MGLFREKPTTDDTSFRANKASRSLARRLGPLPIGASKEQCCDALKLRKKQTPRLSGSPLGKKLTTEPAKVTTRTKSLSSVLFGHTPPKRMMRESVTPDWT